MATSKLPTSIIEYLGKVLGTPVRYPSDCERLSLDIQSKLNEVIGVTTLKRLFGFVNDVKSPRSSTLDILARYAGYPSYEEMARTVCPKGDSAYEKAPDIDVTDLRVGTIIVFRYLPDRKVMVKYLGDLRFRVLESFGSSLHPEDIIVTSYFCWQQPLKIDLVQRGDRNLGRYVAGKVSGLTSIEVLPSASDPIFPE